MAENQSKKVCGCDLHLRVEAESKRIWIPCVGHGPGCPCWEKKLKEGQAQNKMMDNTAK